MLTAAAPADLSDGVASLPVVSAAGGFAGHWSYVPPSRQVPSSEENLPESIELDVTDHARYRATSEPAEPEVAFQFAGAGAVPAAKLRWTGPGESKGSLMLHLLSPDQIEVTWFTSDPGAELNRASGSAQLTRQREPSN